MKLAEKEIQNLEEQFVSVARTSTDQASWAALSSGHSVLKVKNGELVKISPDGTSELIQKIEPHIFVAKGTKFEIK
jgi:hypothetical protein